MKCLQYKLSLDCTDFGSEENPGLEWDDAEECFVINTRNFTGLASVLDYTTNVGSDEFKHFVIYSCKDCGTEEYREARQDQQYPEIVDDEERWNEDDLIEPSFSSDVFEDNIACHIGEYIIAKITISGWVLLITVWDAVLNGYAKGIINNAGDEVLDEDWPVDQMDVSDWWTSTSSKDSFGFQWGTLCTENTLATCSTYPPDIHCEVADYYVPECMQQLERVQVDTGGGNEGTRTIDIYMLRCTAGLNDSYRRSYYGSLNGYNVILRWETAFTSSEYLTWGPESDKSSRTYHKEVVHNYITPWGNLFENLLLMYTDCGYTKASGESMVCTGEQVNWTDHIEIGGDKRIGRALYKGDNVIFGIIGGYYDKISCAMVSCRESTLCWTYPSYIIEHEYGLDAWGAMDYYSDDKIDLVDPNVLDGSEDVQEGFVNILQAYFDAENGGVPQLYTMTFEHRQGAI